MLPVTSSQGKQIPPRPTTETEQYVYDLYFRDLRPSLSSTPLGLGAGDGVSIGALLVSIYVEFLQR